MMADNNLIRATGLWIKVSKTGRTYYVGRLGALKVLVLENTDKDRAENAPTHYLCFGEAQQRQATASPPRRTVPPHGITDPKAYAEALASQFKPDEEIPF